VRCDQDSEVAAEGIGSYRALNTQNSFPSGSARTTHVASAVWPTKTRTAPSDSRAQPPFAGRPAQVEVEAVLRSLPPGPSGTAKSGHDPSSALPAGGSRTTRRDPH